MTGSSRSGWTILSIFFFSGLSSLLYQVVWLKELGYVFGNTVQAAATLIAVFLGGLGLGAAIFARKLLDRPPLKSYAIIELLIGAIGALSPTIFDLLDALYVASWSSVAGSPALLTLFRIGASGLFLLPPTILMGGTLPLLVRWYAARRDQPAGAVSALYGSNTLGACAGVALGGFLLIPTIGLLATIGVAAMTNLLLAFAAWLVSRHESVGTGSATIPDKVESSRSASWILAAAFLTGFCAIAAEIVWSRILVLHLGSSVYAYSLMLFSFLVGIGLGSAIITRYIDRIDTIRALAFIELSLGLILVLQILYFTRFSDFLYAVAAPLSSPSYAATLGVLLTVTLIGLLPPTLLMGATFPLLVRRAAELSSDTVSSATGSIYLFNTIGSVAGSLLAGFVLISAIGTQNTLLLIAALTMFVGVAFLLRISGSRRVGWSLMTFALIALIAVAVLLPSRAVIYAAYEEDADTLKMLREDVSATVALREIRPGELWLELNGVNVAGTAADLIGTQMLQAHLPLLLAGDASRVLHIGFGSGGTAYSVSRHPQVEEIVIAEISPEVLDASSEWLSMVNHGVLADERVRIEINDGRNYVLATPEEFDVILSDSIHPRYAGNGSLYTLEYFQLCREKLADDGVISMWLPFYALTTKNYLEILAAFQAVFPDTTVWYIPDSVNAFTIVVGKMQPGPIPIGLLESGLSTEALAELKTIGIEDATDFMSMLMIDPFGVDALTRSVTPHSDDLPKIEYESGRVINRNASWLANFRVLTDHVSPLGTTFADAPAELIREAERKRAERNRVHLELLTERFTGATSVDPGPRESSERLPE